MWAVRFALRRIATGTLWARDSLHGVLQCCAFFSSKTNPGDVYLVREAIRALSTAAHIMVASDGERALALLNDWPDLVFLDLSLPKLGGLELLAKAHTTPAPIVVFTSSENANEKARALELGAKEFLVKPSSLEDFIKTVQNAIERWAPREAPPSV